MRDIQEQLRRQAEWQKSLRELPFEEKLRRAAALRDSVLALRKTRPQPEKRDDPRPPSR